jgi:LacI family transcriptional regulator
MPQTSIRDVAERAGVAVSSVSRVLSGHRDASPAMRRRVMAAVDELGYVPDILAQSMRRRATRSIGFVVGDISNPLIAEITLGAETTLQRSHYSLLLTNSEDQPELDASHIRLLLQRRVDGLLLSLTSETHPDTLRVLREIAVPVVLIDRELPDTAEVQASTVLVDHKSGMRDAVSHLLDLGHRRVGLVLGSSLRFAREREAGLRSAYAGRKLKNASVVLRGPLERNFAETATAAMLDDAEPATAIVCGANQLLPGTLSELRRRKMRVGRDVSLVSCDEQPLTELFEPPISVIRKSNFEVGVRSAELLLRRLEDPEHPAEAVTLPVEFVPTPSCAPPRIGRSSSLKAQPGSTRGRP